MRLETIVSVLDSTTAHDAVLSHAMALARWYGSDLHVVQTEGARRELEARAAAAATATGAADVRIKAALLTGHPVRSIAEYAKRVGADLLVAPRSARVGFRSAGSFAAAIGAELKTPTMAVPDGHALRPGTDAPFSNVLVAVDFSDVSLRALSTALTLAQRGGGALTVLHVLENFPYETAYSGSGAFRLMQDFQTRVAKANRRLRSLIPAESHNWCDVHIATVSGDAHAGIVSAAAERRADLVILGLPRRSRLEQVVAGSTAHRVLRAAPSPVLLVPGRSSAVAGFTTSWPGFGVHAGARALGRREGPAAWW